jgi:hypothetical protein
MKKHIRIFTSALILCAAILLVSSCNNPSSKENAVKEPDAKATAAPQDTLKLKAYVCPMGPQCGQSDTAGKCPSCGMEMKANPKAKK